MAATTGNFPDDETLQAIGELLMACEFTGFALTFKSDPEGWTVGHAHSSGSGMLGRAYTLRDASRAALRPLDDVLAARRRTSSEP